MFQVEKIQHAVRNNKSAAVSFLRNRFLAIIFTALVFLLVLLAMSGSAQTLEPGANQTEIKSYSRISRAPSADELGDIRRDSDLFMEGARSRKSQDRMQAAWKRGFRIRGTEKSLARMVCSLDEHSTNQLYDHA